MTYQYFLRGHKLSNTMMKESEELYYKCTCDMIFVFTLLRPNSRDLMMCMKELVSRFKMTAKMVVQYNFQKCKITGGKLGKKKTPGNLHKP